MFSNQKEVGESWSQFITARDNGLAGESMAHQFLKPNFQLPRGRLRFYPRSGRVDEDQTIILSPENRLYEAEFFRDGQHAVVIGFEHVNQTPLWFAISSFSVVRYIKPESGTILLGGNRPVIVQLQGISDFTYKDQQPKDESLSAQRMLRWEKLSVSLSVSWARASGFPSIHLLPARFNRWSEVRMNADPGQRGYLRYDITARRCGFRLDDRGIYTFATASTPGVEL